MYTYKCVCVNTSGGSRQLSAVPIWYLKSYHSDKERAFFPIIILQNIDVPSDTIYQGYVTFLSLWTLLENLTENSSCLLLWLYKQPQQLCNCWKPNLLSGQNAHRIESNIRRSSKCIFPEQLTQWTQLYKWKLGKSKKYYNHEKIKSEENKLTAYDNLAAFRRENLSHQVQTLQSLHKSMTSSLVTHCLQYLYSAGCVPRGKVSVLLRPISHSDPCRGGKEDVLSPCLNFTHSTQYPSRISFLNFITMLDNSSSPKKLHLVLSREQPREEHMSVLMFMCMIWVILVDCFNMIH